MPPPVRCVTFISERFERRTPAGLNILKRLFHRPRPDNLDAVCQAIDDALHGEPAIAQIQWWSDQPLRGAGTPHPAGAPQ